MYGVLCRQWNREPVAVSIYMYSTLGIASRARPGHLLGLLTDARVTKCKGSVKFILSCCVKMLTEHILSKGPLTSLSLKSSSTYNMHSRSSVENMSGDVRSRTKAFLNSVQPIFV